jgi:hypothetical protein
MTRRIRMLLLERDRRASCGLLLFRKLGMARLHKLIERRDCPNTAPRVKMIRAVRCCSWRENAGNKEKKGRLGTFRRTHYSTRLRTWSGVGSAACDGFHGVYCMCNHALPQRYNNVASLGESIRNVVRNCK